MSQNNVNVSGRDGLYYVHYDSINQYHHKNNTDDVRPKHLIPAAELDNYELDLPLSQARYDLWLNDFRKAMRNRYPSFEIADHYEKAGKRLILQSKMFQVIIEDNVEIGANTCVDRATMGATIVRKGAKLDNLIQVAHNVEIGSHTVIASQTGIAGSAKIGEWCMFAGQVGIAGHIKIGDRVTVGAQSGIPGNTKSGQTLMGYPAIDPKLFARSAAVYKKLPDMYAELGRLQKEIDELKKQLNK